MKVLLIAPYVHFEFDLANAEHQETLNREDFFPSTALLCLAAMLRANNCEPIMLDLNNAVTYGKKERYLDYCKKIIIDKLNECKPDLVGINCLFSGVFPDVLKFAKMIRSHSPDLKIAIGGLHPTSFPREILTNCEDIDYIAIGEGENTIVSLAAAIKAKNENLLSSIKSFAYRDKDGEVRINREANYIDDLNSLPMPAWDLVNFEALEMNMDHFYNPHNLPLKYRATILTSRACPLACNFCDMFLIMGKKHRKRSAKLVADEIELLNKSYGVNYFSFMDDQLILNKAHIMDTCNEIIKRKLKIAFDAPNALWVNSIREEIIAKMVEAGLVYANLAIEHGDDYIRNKVIGKLLDRKKIFEAARLLKKYKVMSAGNFIMGFPEDTNETLQNSYDMIDELQLDKTGMFTLIPFPQTALFKQVVKDNLFVSNWNLDVLWQTPISHDQAEFVIKPYNMSLDDLHKWREKFDRIGNKYWKTNPAPPSLGRNLSPDDKGLSPRFVR